MAIVADRGLETLQRIAQPIDQTAASYDPLIEAAGNARFVLLGEATHGTHEFYQARAAITQRLIEEKGYTVVAWEADWPDAWRINRYVQHRGSDRTAEAALGDFKRFPIWMWRNREILSLVEWLHTYNGQLPRHRPQVGVYGLDLYSLHTSIDAVVGYLERQDPAAAQAARRRYACFESFGDDPQFYGMIAGDDRTQSCEQEVIQQLLELQQKRAQLLSRDGRVASDELFFAEQNAIVAKEAEQYYRALYRGRPNTWNLRDKHMAATLDRLMAHLERQGEHPKAVVWAHNSHLGDARATSMSARGEWNLGQLLREGHPGEALLVGFSTFEGSVTAASEWGGPAEWKWVRPALDGSYEQFFHQLGLPGFLLPLRDRSITREHLPRELLERAIGVIYLPQSERWSHYFFARIAEQFDYVLHFDETRALEPLEINSEWQARDLPETFPSGV